MDMKTRNEKARVFFQECIELLEKKGRDYNPEGIAFQEEAAAAEDLIISPLGVLWIFMGKHWRALRTFVRNRSAQKPSEPIRGRLLDIATYCSLIAVYLEETNDHAIKS